jgi:N-acetylmuramidase
LEAPPFKRCADLTIHHLKSAITPHGGKGTAMFDADTVAAIRAVATTLHIDPAALLAIAEVESGGQAYAVVDGRKEPLIRFEGHYFDRRLSAKDQTKARALGLSAPVAGAIANPRTQEARWRLLARAAEIDSKAAYESCSWGVGQVMGAHWEWLGFGSVMELVELCRRDVAGQVELMARYIDKAGLGPSLRDKDWTAFARGYNGPGYKKAGYHTKIEAAFRRYSAAAPAATPAQTPAAVPVPPERPKAAPLGKSKRLWTWLTAGGSGVGVLSGVAGLDVWLQRGLGVLLIVLAVYAIATMPDVRKKLGLA